MFFMLCGAWVEKTEVLYFNKYLIFTVPVVILITMKYSLDIERNVDGDPVEVLFHDPMLLVLCIIYVAIIILILYFPW